MNMPFSEILRRIRFRLQGRVVHLRPTSAQKGRVLISYTTLPFLDPRERTLNAHSNRWECARMADEFLSRGYAVDVIDFDNFSFTPRHRYDFFIDVRCNLARLAPRLGSACVNIYHATNAHWLHLNQAEYRRLDELQKRRGDTLMPRRSIEPCLGVEYADIITSVCGKDANDSYQFTEKEICHIPLSTTHRFRSPADKNFENSRKQFIWFGGAGAVHKGLDLVLEAFAAMPEYRLLVCGKFGEQDFQDAYRKELLEAPNIMSLGYIDLSSNRFEEIRNESLGVVFPSCSEGCATSVVVAMHAGLIPIVSRESGIETENFGITLEQNSIETIMHAVRTLAQEPPEQLGKRAMETWDYANQHHTREQFTIHYRQFVDMLEQRYE